MHPFSLFISLPDIFSIAQSDVPKWLITNLFKRPPYLIMVPYLFQIALPLNQTKQSEQLSILTLIKKV